jgi:hypothetical protein
VTGCRRCRLRHLALAAAVRLLADQLDAGHDPAEVAAQLRTLTGPPEGDAA